MNINGASAEETADALFTVIIEGMDKGQSQCDSPVLIMLWESGSGNQCSFDLIDI